jgi:methionyl-tRNA synthetase
LLANYCRARGLRTLFVCGSDQYGTASEARAAAEGVSPATLCAKYHTLHHDIYQWFRMQFDVFGQTPTPQQTQIVQDVFRRLCANGFIEERETEQPFCPVHSSFLADRFIEGECSICGYTDARGDQCDQCGNLLDPLEPESRPATDAQQQREPEGDTILKATGWLLNPRCKLDGATPERRKTKHLFLRLDTLTEDIITWFDTVKSAGGFSANAVAITQSWIDKGLQPRAITRDLRWAVPIPTVEGLSEKEYENKVFYVWFDAPLGYISITKSYTDEDLDSKDWERWWRNPKDVELFQFMERTVPFYTLSCRPTWDT